MVCYKNDIKIIILASMIHKTTSLFNFVASFSTWPEEGGGTVLPHQ
jgi:hypothetical protein